MQSIARSTSGGRDRRPTALVTGGAGFLGSHLCERLLAEGNDVLCVDNFFTGTQAATSRTCSDNPRFELMRHDVTVPALCRGRRDLQPRLPGLADPLPARSGADDQDQRAWRDQHAGPGQAAAGADPAGLDQRGLRRPARSIRRPRTTGATSIRSAARLLRRGQALRRDAVLRLPAPARAARSRSRASSTPTARACIPNDGRVVSNFIVQALQRRADHDLRRRQPDPLLLLRRRPDRRAHGADGEPADEHRPDQPRQPARVHRSASSPRSSSGRPARRRSS